MYQFTKHFQEKCYQLSTRFANPVRDSNLPKQNYSDSPFLGFEDSSYFPIISQSRPNYYQA